MRQIMSDKNENRSLNNIIFPRWVTIGALDFSSTEFRLVGDADRKEEIHYEIGGQVSGFTVEEIKISDHKIEITLKNPGKGFVQVYPTNMVKYKYNLP
jgi:hypothetical protein